MDGRKYCWEECSVLERVNMGSNSVGVKVWGEEEVLERR